MIIAALKVACFKFKSIDVTDIIMMLSFSLT